VSLAPSIICGKTHPTNESGSGLGLYGVEKNLKDWGGSLKITSILGKGTEIEMNFNPAHS
jgi:chemotaxis protein histidine kinase CheA